MLKTFLKTDDNVDIAINLYDKGNNEVVIVAPGWCMTKDSVSFKHICKMFSLCYDVICFDFRGHGKSGGYYTFMAKELLDMDCVVNYAIDKGYKKIYLVGFSLGAGLAVIYAANHSNIDKVIAISVPCDFDKIENKMWKKEAWGETFKKFEMDRFLSVRPYPIPLKKIKPVEIIKHLKCPTLFIAGEKDPTVQVWHTENLFNEAVCKKELYIYENGCHAEDLYIHFPRDFAKRCFGWLKG